MTIQCFSSCQQTTIVFWHIDNTSDRQIEPDKLGLNVLKANTNHKSPCGADGTLVNVNCLKSLVISPVVCCWVTASHDCKFEQQDSLLLCSDCPQYWWHWSGHQYFLSVVLWMWMWSGLTVFHSNLHFLSVILPIMPSSPLLWVFLGGRLSDQFKYF